MAETGLNGPFALQPAEIEKEITRTSPGVYILDRSHEDGPFHISYVGRSDTDVKARLLEHGAKYKRFKYEYYGTPEDAFAKECDLYHDFNPPSTIAHPPRPTAPSGSAPAAKSSARLGPRKLRDLCPPALGKADSRLRRRVAHEFQ